MTFHQLREHWRIDLYRHTGETSWRHLLTHVLFYDGGERFSDGVKYMFYFRLCRYLKTQRPRILFWPLYRLAMRLFTRYKYKFGCSNPIEVVHGIEQPNLYLYRVNSRRASR